MAHTAVSLYVPLFRKPLLCFNIPIILPLALYLYLAGLADTGCLQLAHVACHSHCPGFAASRLGARLMVAHGHRRYCSDCIMAHWQHRRGRYQRLAVVCSLRRQGDSRCSFGHVDLVCNSVEWSQNPPPADQRTYSRIPWVLDRVIGIETSRDDIFTVEMVNMVR